MKDVCWDFVRREGGVVDTSDSRVRLEWRTLKCLEY